MDLSFLIWSFLIVFMVHNFEEIIMIEKWFHTTYPDIKEKLPAFARNELEKRKQITTVQFTMAVFVLFLIVSLFIILTILQGYFFLFVGFNLFFSLNIVTHITQAIVLRCYVPGLWTTIFVILPYNLYFYYYLELHQLYYTFNFLDSVIIVLCLLPALLLAHKLAEKWS